MAEAVKQVARNQKAYHDYFIEEKFEAGIELAGTEVKSIRMGNVNLKDSFCLIKDGQLSVLGMHISPYEKGNIFNKDPRLRKVRLALSFFPGEENVVLYFEDCKKRVGSRCAIRPSLLEDLRERLGEEKVVVK